MPSFQVVIQGDAEPKKVEQSPGQPVGEQPSEVPFVNITGIVSLPVADDKLEKVVDKILKSLGTKKMVWESVKLVQIQRIDEL